MTQPIKDRVYIMNDGKVERIVPELAVEIGLNESIMLLQIDFWIGISDHYIDGCWWTYQSTREMKDKAFPYWGIGTIHRTVVSLEKQGLVIVGNHNKRPGDNTRWFALNRDGMKQLSKKCPSVQFISPERDESRDDYTQGLEHQRNTIETPRSKMEQPVPERNGAFQNGTTLPESTTENTHTEKDSAADATKPAKPKKPRAPKADPEVSKAVGAVIEAWKDALPAPPATNVYQNRGIRKVAEEIHNAGFTPDQVTCYMRAQYEESFWRGRYMKLEHVAQNMPAWLSAHNGVKPTTANLGHLDGILAQSRERQTQLAIVDKASA